MARRQKSTTVKILNIDVDVNFDKKITDDEKEVDDFRPQTELTRAGIHWCDFGLIEDYTLIHQHPQATDIVQGTLGNCWFLCALSLVAERPELLSRILKTTNEEFNATKMVTIRLFRYGQWQRMNIDAKLPCNDVGKLIFSKAKRHQLYVPLIEKALATLYGGYDCLVGGHLSEAMTNLTGFPCEILWLPPNSKLWSKEEVLDLLSTCRYELTIASMLEDLWVQLISFHSVGFILSVSCGKTFLVVNRKIVDVVSSEHFQKLGLLNNHAYSILDLKQVDGQRLVKLRNPWGSLVWNGKYSDWDNKLHNHTEKKEKGIFWILFEDLARYFEQIIVGKVQLDWHQYALKGRFPSSSHNAKEWNLFELYIDENSKDVNYAQVIISLFQKPDNTGRRRAVFLTLYELCDNAASKVTPVLGSFIGASVCNVQNTVTIEAEMKRGKRYLLGVFAFDVMNKKRMFNDNQNGTYVLRAYSSKVLRIDCFRCPNMALVGDMLIGYTIATGDVSQPQANIEIYQSARSWAGVVAVVKNNHPKRHLAVTMCVNIEGKTKKTLQSDTADNHNIEGYFESLIINTNDVDGPIVRRSQREESEEISDGSTTIIQTNKSKIEIADDFLQWQDRYLVSSRQAFQTFDLIPPKHW